MFLTRKDWYYCGTIVVTTMENKVEGRKRAFKDTIELETELQQGGIHCKSD